LKINFDPFKDELYRVIRGNNVHEDLAFTSSINYQGIDSSYYIYIKSIFDIIMITSSKEHISSFYFKQGYVLNNMLLDNQGPDHCTVLDLIMDYMIHSVSSGIKKESIPKDVYRLLSIYENDYLRIAEFKWFHYNFIVILPIQVENINIFLKSVPWFRSDSDLKYAYSEILDFIQKRHKLGMYNFYTEKGLIELESFVEKNS